MEITIQALEDRRKQIMAEMENTVGNLNYLRGCLGELQRMEDFLNTEIVTQAEMDDQAIHAV